MQQYVSPISLPFISLVIQRKEKFLLWQNQSPEDFKESPQSLLPLLICVYP